jgi:hypothetical protein
MSLLERRSAVLQEIAYCDGLIAALGERLKQRFNKNVFLTSGIQGYSSTQPEKLGLALEFSFAVKPDAENIRYEKNLRLGLVINFEALYEGAQNEFPGGSVFIKSWHTVKDGRQSSWWPTSCALAPTQICGFNDRAALRAAIEAFENHIPEMYQNHLQTLSR